MSRARSAQGQIKPSAAGAGISRSRSAMASASVSPAAGRITDNDGRFRVEPVLEQPVIDRDHFLESDRVLSFRCARVVGNQRCHTGSRGQVRGQAAVALRAAQGVAAAVQVDQCAVGSGLRWPHPLDGNARDGDTLVAGDPWAGGPQL